MFRTSTSMGMWCAGLLALGGAGCGQGLDDDRSAELLAAVLQAGSQASADGGEPSPAQPEPGPTAPFAPLRTATTPVDDVPRAWAEVFPIADTRAVDFAIAVPVDAVGHHTAALLLTAPGQTPYQRLALSFAAGVEADPSVGEQAAEPDDGAGYRVWSTLPVSGTTIERASIRGTWTAELWLDTDTSPRAVAQFELQ